MRVSNTTIDKLCIFPGFQQVIGVGTIVSNVVKCAYDIFLMAVNLPISIQYADADKYSELKNISRLLSGKKLTAIKTKIAKLKNSAKSNSVDAKKFLACKAHYKAKAHFAEHALYIGIGVVRVVPILGTVYSWNKAHQNAATKTEASVHSVEKFSEANTIVKPEIKPTVTNVEVVRSLWQKRAYDYLSEVVETALKVPLVPIFIDTVVNGTKTTQAFSQDALALMSFGGLVGVCDATVALASDLLIKKNEPENIEPSSLISRTYACAKRILMYGVPLGITIANSYLSHNPKEEIAALVWHKKVFFFYFAGICTGALTDVSRGIFNYAQQKLFLQQQTNRR